jgi:hypothetical protein
MSSSRVNEFSTSNSIGYEVSGFGSKATGSAALGLATASTEAKEVSSSLSEGVEQSCEVLCTGKKGTRTTVWQYHRTLVAPKN